MLSGESLQISSFLAFTSSFLFFVYGISCFFSAKLILEFKRYGFEKYRVLIALVEILGSLGLIGGLYYNPLMLLSSAVLTVLMIGAVFVRMKIKDPILLWLPALVLLFLNMFLFFDSLGHR
jgi:hypothetical protein